MNENLIQILLTDPNINNPITTFSLIGWQRLELLAAANCTCPFAPLAIFEAE